MDRVGGGGDCSSKFHGCPRERREGSKSGEKLSTWYMDDPLLRIVSINILII